MEKIKEKRMEFIGSTVMPSPVCQELRGDSKFCQHYFNKESLSLCT